MHEFLENLEKCERWLSELLIEFTIDESEAWSSIKTMYPEKSNKVMYKSLTKKRNRDQKSNSMDYWYETEIGS